MRALLVRVGADQSEGGGWWNGPVNSATREFVFVPIPEAFPIRRGFAKSYSLISPFLERFGVTLPSRLARRNMHLDPDFDHLTYGDRGEDGARGDQIKRKLGAGDLLVFYASLADVNPNPQLVYAIIGLYVIGEPVDAVTIRPPRWDENAHTRRVLSKTAKDIVVRAKRKLSGRLKTCLPIGEFRNRAYRVTRPLLRKWGGLSVTDGYLQRSARLPEFLDAAAFYEWFKEQRPQLLARNN
jgi:hypothetical protein